MVASLAIKAANTSFMTFIWPVAPPDHPWYMTNTYWLSVDAHFQDMVGYVCPFVLIIKAANTLETISAVPWSKISLSTVAYLNGTINVKPEMRNRRFELMGLAKPDEPCGLMGTGPGLTRQEAVGRVFGRVRHWTVPFLLSKPGLPAGYSDPLLTLNQLNGETLAGKSSHH